MTLKILSQITALMLSILIISGCQSQRVEINNIEKKVTENIFTQEPSEEPPSINSTKESTYETLDFTDQDNNIHFSFNYFSVSNQKLIIEELNDQLPIYTIQSFFIKNDSTILAQINIYDEYGLENALDEIKDFEADFETENLAIEIVDTNEGFEFSKSLLKSFYAEEL